VPEHVLTGRIVDRDRGVADDRGEVAVMDGVDLVVAAADAGAAEALGFLRFDDAVDVLGLANRRLGRAVGNDDRPGVLYRYTAQAVLARAFTSRRTAPLSNTPT
jgi:hypothetical protein